MEISIFNLFTIWVSLRGRSSKSPLEGQPNASIAPKSGVFAPNTAAAAKTDPWAQQS
jgi:hypothetical protein